VDVEEAVEEEVRKTRWWKRRKSRRWRRRRRQRGHDAE